MARESKCKKVYTFNDGSEGQSAKPGITALAFQFNNGSVHSVTADQFPEDVRQCATYHGLSQKLGDAFAKSADADEAEEKFLAMFELLESGNWLAGRESAGPRMSQLFLAVCKAYADAGQELDDDAQAQVKETLKTKEGRDEAMKVPEIEAALADIKLEALIAKRDAAKKKVAESGGFQGFNVGGTAQGEPQEPAAE